MACWENCMQICRCWLQARCILKSSSLSIQFPVLLHPSYLIYSPLIYPTSFTAPHLSPLIHTPTFFLPHFSSIICPLSFTLPHFSTPHLCCKCLLSGTSLLVTCCGSCLCACSSSHLASLISSSIGFSSQVRAAVSDHLLTSHLFTRSTAVLLLPLMPPARASLLSLLSRPFCPLPSVSIPQTLPPYSRNHPLSLRRPDLLHVPLHRPPHSLVLCIVTTFP